MPWLDFWLDEIGKIQERGRSLSIVREILKPQSLNSSMTFLNDSLSQLGLQI